MKTTIQTKFGSASLTPAGYYRIHSCNGNRGKFLHRLIFEDFYGIAIPNGFVVHHKDGNKTNNCILNLQLLSDNEHKRKHKIGENHPLFGKNHRESSRKKMSESKTKLMNTTGYFGVTKIKASSCKQGFKWGYHYKDETGKRRLICSVSLEKLKERVIGLGCEWRVLDDT